MRRHSRGPRGRPGDHLGLLHVRRRGPVGLLKEPPLLEEALLGLGPDGPLALAGWHEAREGQRGGEEAEREVRAVLGGDREALARIAVRTIARRLDEQQLVAAAEVLEERDHVEEVGQQQVGEGRPEAEHRQRRHRQRGGLAAARRPRDVCGARHCVRGRADAHEHGDVEVGGEVRRVQGALGVGHGVLVGREDVRHGDEARGLHDQAPHGHARAVPQTRVALPEGRTHADEHHDERKVEQRVLLVVEGVVPEPVEAAEFEGAHRVEGLGHDHDRIGHDHEEDDRELGATPGNDVGRLDDAHGGVEGEHPHHDVSQSQVGDATPQPAVEGAGNHDDAQSPAPPAARGQNGVEEVESQRQHHEEDVARVALLLRRGLVRRLHHHRPPSTPSCFRCAAASTATKHALQNTVCPGAFFLLHDLRYSGR